MNEKQLRNTGFSCGSNIELGKCDNNTIKFAIFFHEVGHVIQERKKFKYINTFQKELNATKIGLNIARKYGFKINHEIKMFLSKCAYHYSKCNRSRLKLRRLDFCK
jgi:hypothetical protein